MFDLYTITKNTFDIVIRKFSKLSDLYERINSIAMSTYTSPYMKDWACFLCDQIDEVNKEILSLYYKINTYNTQQELQDVLHQINVMEIEISAILREYKEFACLM